MTVRTKRVWIFQSTRQVRKHGPKNSSWFIGFIDLNGTRQQKWCGRGTAGKKLASRLRLQVQAELIAGTYESEEKKSWEDFRQVYQKRIMDGMEPGTWEVTRSALDMFERISKPKMMRAISDGTIADFIAARRKHKRSKKSNQDISPATINKELRCLRAALRKASKWGFLPKMPDIPFLKEPGKIPDYVTPEHFGALYGACDTLKEPRQLPFPTGDWWRGLLMFAYMTGWRIGSILSLQWEHVDLEQGTALSLAKDNKGKRDQRIPLHPVIVEHLRKLRSFDARVFPWAKDRRKLFTHLHRLQDTAGVKPEGGKPYYGFHSLRRAFATMNADRMTGDTLQALMQHKDYQTTQRYINLARQLRPTVQDLFVPKVGLEPTHP